MADNNTLNYSSFDFESLKADMITNMKANGLFKDYNFEGSNINQLIELFAGLGDLLNYYINMVADESFLRTADIYENINKIVELIGYNPSGPKSSEVTITASCTFNSSKDDNYFTIKHLPTFENGVQIEAGQTLTATSVSEDGLPIIYTPISSTTFVSISGSNSFIADINLIQGTYQQIFFSGNGQQFQKYIIDDLDAIEEYIIVKVGGLEWTKVNNIYVEGSDKIYSTRYGKDKKVEIQFGNGIFGQVPYAGDSNIEVWYIKSMNLKGAIGPDELTIFNESVFLKDIDNNSNDGAELVFSISQTESSVGHNVPLTEEEIRNLAPKQYRTQDRLMSSNDHQDLIIAELGNYISQVICLNQDDYYLVNPGALVQETSGFNYNNVYMYILPKYGYEVNQNLKSRVSSYLDAHKLITLNYVFKDLNYVNFNFNISYFKNPSSIKNYTQIQTDIGNVIRNYFSKTNMSIGGVVKYSELLKNLADVEGTSSLTLAISSDGGYLDSDSTIPVSSGDGWYYRNIYMGAIQYPVINNSGLIISLSGDEF